MKVATAADSLRQAVAAMDFDAQQQCDKKVLAVRAALRFDLAELYMSSYR